MNFQVVSVWKVTVPAEVVQAFREVGRENTTYAPFLFFCKSLCDPAHFVCKTVTGVFLYPFAKEKGGKNGSENLS